MPVERKFSPCDFSALPHIISSLIQVWDLTYHSAATALLTTAVITAKWAVGDNPVSNYRTLSVPDLFGLIVIPLQYETTQGPSLTLGVLHIKKGEANMHYHH